MARPPATAAPVGTMPPAKRAPSNLVERVVTGVLAAAVAVGAAWLGGWAWALFLAAAAVGAQHELYGLMRKAGAAPLAALGLPLGALAALRFLLPWAGPVLVVGGVAVLLAALARPRQTPLFDVAGTLLGVFYPAYLLGYGVVLREAAGFRLDAGDGFWLVLTVLVCIWAADTFAYFAGRSLGRHKLAPRISPKKTWEGAAGGLLGALVVGFACRALVLPALSALDVAVVAACAAVAGLGGDLAESLFKRSVDVKDSATWLRGHGGLLDRLDAATVAVPLATLYLLHVARLFG